MNDTIEFKGLTFRVELKPDDSHGAPWEECDGHGPVRESNDASGEGRFKRPGERVLHAQYRTAWVYDWQEAMKIAKRDGWGMSDEDKAKFKAATGFDPTPGQIALAAVQSDFDRLRRYLEGDWSYVGVVVTLLDVDGKPTYERASLWGIESDCGACIDETARELASEIARPLGRRKYIETRVRVRS